MRYVLLTLLLFLLIGCATMPPADPPCPSIDEDFTFWYVRVPFASQAREEHWSVAKICATVAATDPSVKGTAPFYWFYDNGSPKGGFCYCPVA